MFSVDSVKVRLKRKSAWTRELGPISGWKPQVFVYPGVLDIHPEAMYVVPRSVRTATGSLRESLV